MPWSVASSSFAPEAARKPNVALDGYRSPSASSLSSSSSRFPCRHEGQLEDGTAQSIGMAENEKKSILEDVQRLKDLLEDLKKCIANFGKKGEVRIRSSSTRMKFRASVRIGIRHSAIACTTGEFEAARA